MFRNQSNQKATQNKKFKTICRLLLQKVAVVLYFVRNLNSFLNLVEQSVIFLQEYNFWFKVVSEFLENLILGEGD